MGSQRPRPVVLDAGALIGVERANRRVIRLLELAGEVHVPAAVVAQVWRNPARQVRLVRLLAAEPVSIAPLDTAEAQAVGHICGSSGTTDVVDASVVLLTRRVGGVAITNDPDDLRAIDPGVDLAVC